jgi:hypothetical protein
MKILNENTMISSSPYPFFVIVCFVSVSFYTTCKIFKPIGTEVVCDDLADYHPYRKEGESKINNKIQINKRKNDSKMKFSLS